MMRRLARFLFTRVFHPLAFARPPDFVIGDPARPYMRRWFIVPRNRVCNIYLHQFLRPDDDRALHDHPWISVSLLLSGRYFEVTRDRGEHRRIEYAAGAVKFMRAVKQHRIDLAMDPYSPKGAIRYMPCWTLFVTGPRIREWGFQCPQGWRHWKEFTRPGAKGEIGKGCE